VGLLPRAAGYGAPMADRPDDDQLHGDDERVSSRAELLPEEEAAGSDDPDAQAAAILGESEQRVLDRDASPGTHHEERTSDEATPPV
jgi:hypothetical protein